MNDGFDAVALLGQLVRKARIERKLKAVDVTDRAGISRGLLRRIETGDPGCTIGAVFEVQKSRAFNSHVTPPLLECDRLAQDTSRQQRARRLDARA